MSVTSRRTVKSTPATRIMFGIQPAKRVLPAWVPKLINKFNVYTCHNVAEMKERIDSVLSGDLKRRQLQAKVLHAYILQNSHALELMAAEGLYPQVTETTTETTSEEQSDESPATTDE